MQAQLFSELTGHDCTCRVCGAGFVGHGALCEVHAAEIAARQRQENAAAEAVIEARIEAQRRARQARGRSEWREVVDAPGGAA